MREKFTKSQEEKIQNFVDDKVKEFKINVKQTKNGDAGYAEYYKPNELPHIQIPPLNNAWRAGVAIHEIGHVVLGHVALNKKGNNIDKRPSYQHEYETERFTIEQLATLKLPKKEYIIEAKRYVMECMAKALNRHHPFHKIPKEIIEWTGIDVKNWIKAKKVFVHRDFLKSVEDIRIDFTYS